MTEQKRASLRSIDRRKFMQLCAGSLALAAAGCRRELWPIFQADLPMTLLYPFASITVVNRRARGLSSPYWADPVSHMEELWLEDRSDR